MQRDSSDSSDTESDTSIKNETIYPANAGLSLQEVQEMVREYEREEKKERKAHKHRMDLKETLSISPEDIAKLTLTKKQINQLKPKKPRSEAQIEAAQRLANANKAKAAERKAKKAEEEKVLDARSDKSKPGIQVKIPTVKPRGKYAVKPKPLPEPEEEFEEEPEVFKSSRGFQGRKPKVEIEEEPEEDELEKKVKKLDKLNNVLASSNPFLAQVMASRGIRY